jgi:flagellar hook-associated protein 1 FlgK
MSLSSALSSAVSGLRTTQAGMDVVAQNVANANTIGYTRRTVAPVQALAGPRTSGVRTGEIERALDTILQKQLRLETSGAAYTSTMARFAGEIGRLFGEPGTVGALDTSLNDFTQAMQALAAEPADFGRRSGVLNAGAILASHIATIAESVQALRSEAEGRIASAVERANGLLKGIAELDRNIISSPANQTEPGLLDERDRLINELSKLMDIHVIKQPTGSVTLTTTGGLTLFNGGTPALLAFDARGKLAPGATWSAVDTERGVGTITATMIGGTAVDVIAGNLIRSGEIGAALELRDTTLVQAQRQLDELAAGLSRALSDRPVTGAATPPGPPDGFTIDLAGLQAGNTVTLDYKDNASGATRRILLVATNGTPPIPAGDTSDPNATIIRFDLSLGFAGAVTALNTELTNRGVALVASNLAGSTLQIVDDGVANATDVAALSASITVTTMTNTIGATQLPFFIDSGSGAPYTGKFTGQSQITGFAQRIKVNTALQANRAEALVVYSTSPLTPQGDTRRPLFLVDALTQSQQAFSSATGIGGPGPAYVSTLADFARRVVERHGANAESAERLDEGQSIALAAVESRFAETSGVNVDQEMSQLVQLQTAYGANARVMTAIRDMFDLLMRM